MGDPQGFLKLRRVISQNRPADERVKDFKEIAILKSKDASKVQASRCMDCGIPFCHFSCPIGNIIPEWNDNMFAGKWEKAFSSLNETNNLPEITGRVCPAPCEYGCVLGINDDPVTIRDNELAIIEYAFKSKFVRPNPPKKRTGKKVLVVGSGPSGLCAADELNKLGHSVVVIERDDAIGGILRYGIPDFKLEKHFIDRRINIWKKEGIVFKTSTEIGKTTKEFDAVCLAIGSRQPRDIKIEGRELSGIHFAMDFLIQSNIKNNKKKINNPIDIKGKNIVVIGGGDTGADCIGVANRRSAKSVTQIEILPCPPRSRQKENPWPTYPSLYKTSTSHEEGADRIWCVLTKRFLGENGHVNKLECVKVEFVQDEKTKNRVMKEIPNSTFTLDADIVVLALGFVHAEHNGLLQNLKLKFDGKGNIETDSNYMTEKKGVFAAGDCRRGASLIVWAIYEGRQAAYSIHRYLML